ncbi:hypothetical protein [Allomuricauda sp. d1]|uniref:hypothetical protein n=1 Tax=Allomuricauda sp. d1 TaxID=3136725 RepID=UPI0031CE99F1
MKKAMKISTVMAILSVSLASFANGPADKKGNNSDEVVKNIIDVDVDPTFMKKGDKLYMNLLNLDQEKVTVKVYDSNGRIVYKETFENSLIIEKAFNFEKAYKDYYTVVVIDDNKKFTEKVEVK